LQAPVLGHGRGLLQLADAVVQDRSGALCQRADLLALRGEGIHQIAVGVLGGEVPRALAPGKRAGEHPRRAQHAPPAVAGAVQEIPCPTLSRTSPRTASGKPWLPRSTRSSRSSSTYTEATGDAHSAESCWHR